MTKKKLTAVQRQERGPLNMHKLSIIIARRIRRNERASVTFILDNLTFSECFIENDRDGFAQKTIESLAAYLKNKWRSKIDKSCSKIVEIQLFASPA